MACKKVEPVDTGDSAVEEYPCAAPYFPVSLGSRSFQLNTYRGRFEQGLTEEVVEQSFVGLAELSSSDLEACVYSGISPFGAGSDYTLFGVGEEWLYLLADGDDSNKAEPDVSLHHRHQPLVGGRAAKAEEYPDALIWGILRGVVYVWFYVEFFT